MIFVLALSIVLRLVLVGPPILIHHKQHPLFDYRPQRVIYLCHCISIHNAEYSIYSATLTHFESVQVLRVTDADWEKKTFSTVWTHNKYLDDDRHYRNVNGSNFRWFGLAKIQYSSVQEALYYAYKSTTS